MKWFYKNTYEEAKKYNTLSKFRKGSPGAHNAAEKNGWLKDYTWMPTLRKTWTYKQAKEEAQKYKTRKELEKNNRSVYRASKKNGWLDSFTWFVDGNKLRADRDRKWTYETTKQEAMKYKTKSEFSKGNRSAYIIACKNKWIDDFIWLEDRRFNIYTDKIDSVYVFDFTEQN